MEIATSDSIRLIIFCNLNNSINMIENLETYIKI